MKLKVLRHFYDGEDHNPGETIVVDDEYGKQLLNDKRKLVEAIKAKKEEK